MGKKFLAGLVGSVMLFSLVSASCASNPAGNPSTPQETNSPQGQETNAPSVTPEHVPEEVSAQSFREYPEVILGKDDWLYWGNPINEAMRYGVLDNAQMGRIVNELSYISRMLKEQGVDFLFIFTPDKYLIYPEYMPDIYEEGSIPSSYDRLIELMGKSNIDFIDFRPFLQEWKKEVGYRLYFMRDRRWNSLGNFLGVQEILTHLSKKLPVPQFELQSVDTSENRITTDEWGNDLNNLIQSFAPWQERGAPEAVYSVKPEPQAPSVLWYGTCFSPAMINLAKEGWAGDITYVSMWEEFGFPASLRYDISRRLTNQKLVIVEMNEHYRFLLDKMLIPEPPAIGNPATSRYHYNWDSSTLLKGWKKVGNYDIDMANGVALIRADNPETAPALQTAVPLGLEPSRDYHLAIKVNSPDFSGIRINLSLVTEGRFVMEYPMGQHIYKGENTVIFDIPPMDQPGSLRSIVLHIGDTPGVYGISQIALYSNLRP